MTYKSPEDEQDRLANREILTDLEGRLPAPLPLVSEYAEIVFACSDPAESRRIRRGLDSGKLRPLLKRVYTSNLTDELGDIVRGDVFFLLARLYPDAVISHRSGLVPHEIQAGAGEPHEVIYLTYGYTERVEWPGITVSLLKGPKALSSDRPVVTGFGLRLSSLERALLENMQPSRTTDRGKKTLARAEIVRWLKWQQSFHGNGTLLRLISDSEAIAEQLGMPREYEALRQLIAKVLSSTLGSGRQRCKIFRDLVWRPDFSVWCPPD
jgi:hypothetical protein